MPLKTTTRAHPRKSQQGPCARRATGKLGNETQFKPRATARGRPMPFGGGGATNKGSGPGKYRGGGNAEPSTTVGERRGTKKGE